MTLIDDPELNGIPVDATYDFYTHGRGNNLVDKILNSETRIIIAILPFGEAAYHFLEYLYD